MVRLWAWGAAVEILYPPLSTEAAVSQETVISAQSIASASGRFGNFIRLPLFGRAGARKVPGFPRFRYETVRFAMLRRASPRCCAFLTSRFLADFVVQTSRSDR